MTFLPMTNIKTLRDNLKKQDFHITAFPFIFKKRNYIVPFEVADNLPEKDKYYIAILTFIKNNDFNNRYSVKANSLKFEFGPVKPFCKFFEIEYTDDWNNFFNNFYSYFGKFVPEQPLAETSEAAKDFMVHQLASRHYHDPNAIYCYEVRRNGKRNNKQCHRTVFNSDLAFHTRPELFETFKNDNTISFCFSPKKSDEKTDMEIIYNFSQKHGL